LDGLERIVQTAGDRIQQAQTGLPSRHIPLIGGIVELLVLKFLF
jgi:hypothetical protein